MKRIFLDTNFIFDCFIRKEYFEVCDKFLKIVSLRGIPVFVSYLSVANFAYILRKEPLEKIQYLIKKVITTFNIIPNDKFQLDNASEMKVKDFEDALQYCAAKDYKCDYIITRNQKDFSFSTIPVLSAEEFLDLLKNEY